MPNKPHFNHPVQTAPALEKAFKEQKIHRSLFVYGAARGLFGEAAYRSENIWLFDTSHPDFDTWLAAHWTQKRVKGRLKKEQETSKT